MGCCCSSPYTQRRYRDPATDEEEDFVPIRYFSTNRVGSNFVPDDIGGLPSTHLQEYLASSKDIMLYQAELDHGKAFRFFSFQWLLFIKPPGLIEKMSCDEMCCWVRKEYSTRTYFRIYPNRIDVNEPTCRCPFGCLGCGSWNGDKIVSHPFDRGAFGFQQVRCGAPASCFCCQPVFGGVVARHRCQCNGPLWNRMFTDCGGWWCDEWLCQMCFCSYQYTGLAYPDEAAFAASIALQAYFEGRAIGPDDMQQCIDFWRLHISERWNPIDRKRPVCCEPIIVPTAKCVGCYKCTHPKRTNPYPDIVTTTHLTAAYEQYERKNETQIMHFNTFYGPMYLSTLCRSCGCRRFFGRKGVFFCTEGCRDCSRKAGDPAPPFDVHDFDNDWDASTVLLKVLGPPPKNVCMKRWRWDPEAGENYLEEYPVVPENVER